MDEFRQMIFKENDTRPNKMQLMKGAVKFRYVMGFISIPY